jgi:hypothetical protein
MSYYSNSKRLGAIPNASGEGSAMEGTSGGLRQPKRNNEILGSARSGTKRKRRG